MKLSTYERRFNRFAAYFHEACTANDGVFSEQDSIGKGKAYIIPTAFGDLQASIHCNDWKSTRGKTHIESIYLRWPNYCGPAVFPLHGDFNQHSHKWNITYSAGTVEDARREALQELSRRLRVLKTDFPITPNSTHT
jgi:hypothetical protein